MGTYTQCEMRREVEGGGVQIHTAWIPTEFAKVGRHIQIREPREQSGCLVGPEKEWQDGWVVTERYTSMDREAIDQQRSAQKAFATKLDRKKKR